MPDSEPPHSETGEFEIIARYFAPLASHAGARGLLDDVALIAADGPVVVTTDAIVETVHFLRDDPLDQVARKALRVNLSDLAAKGAAPFGYLLTLFWPADRPASDIGRLAAGLAEDQTKFCVTLLGGDTVSTPGPLSLSVMMLGRAGAHTPSRTGAKPGDSVWVTGTIGDSGLGLAALRGETFDDADRDYLADRYRLPSPRVDLGSSIAGVASAAMDVSDGLIADAGKLAAASGVRIEIDLGAVPLSPAAARWVARQSDAVEARGRLAGFGDDYEILFTTPGSFELGAVCIGRVVDGTGIGLVAGGRPVISAHPGGYVHRIGR
jgi:thiamine-monophosphate kinase